MRTRLIWALAVLALVVAACSPGDASGGQLDGTDWVLRSYELDGTLTIVPDNLYADAEFAAQRVRGFAGCNEFDALYRAGGRTLFISQAAVTLRACDEETMAFEQAVLGLLDSSRTYTARRDTLTIYGAGRNELLVYDAAPRNPVRGEWQVTAFNNGAGAVTSVIAGTEIDIAFGLASVGGFAGCNSFSGTYGTNGNIIRIGALATTRIACDQEVMDQETAFLEALQGVALIETRGPQVNLTDLRGAIKVTLVRPEPLAPASPGPSAEPTSEPTEEARPTPTPTPDTDAHADSHADSDACGEPDADSRGIGWTERPSVVRAATRCDRRDVRSGRERGDAGNHLLRGHVVHGDQPGGPGLPLLRPGRDHRPVRSVDAGHGRDDLGRHHAVRAGCHGG